MDTTQEEKQRGPVSQTIGFINNLMNARRLLSVPFNGGSRFAFQAIGRGMATFLVSNPWVWGILLAIFVFAAVFIIVFSGPFGGIPEAPTTELNNQMFNPGPATEATPAATLTEAPMPPPAEP